MTFYTTFIGHYGKDEKIRTENLPTPEYKAGEHMDTGAVGRKLFGLRKASVSCLWRWVQDSVNLSKPVELSPMMS